jgi:hypothetical protein
MGAEPPPPPQVSPDGKFYWDGQRWGPMPEPPPPLVSPDGLFYWDGERWVPTPAPAPLGVARRAPAPPLAVSVKTRSAWDGIHWGSVSQFYWDGKRWVPMQAPPLPFVSPDGQSYWDGESWVARPAPAPQKVPAPDHEQRPDVTLDELLDRG